MTLKTTFTLALALLLAGPSVAGAEEQPFTLSSNASAASHDVRLSLGGGVMGFVDRDVPSNDNGDMEKIRRRTRLGGMLNFYC